MRLVTGCLYFGPTAQLVSNRVTSPQAAPRAVTQVRRDGLPALRDANRHQLLRDFPELPVDEIGSKAAQECELFGLPGPDLLRTPPSGPQRIPLPIHPS